jgi:hypothetical protein
MLASPQRPASRETTTYVFVAGNPEAQRLMETLLSRFQDIGIRTAGDEIEPLLIVECDDEARAQSLHDIVVTIDRSARLLEPSTVDAVPVAGLVA